MGEALAAALFAVAAWWLGTAAILLLGRLPRSTYRWSFGAASALLAAALIGLAAARHDTGAAGAYWGFGLALLVWAWQEMAFLMGYVTGPRRAPCPPGASGATRLRCAVQAILYHELVLLSLGAAIALALRDGANPVGLWTYAVLWLMRLSAKLNLFLGVRNPGAGMLPEHLRYLGSYFRQRGMNALYPVSILGTAALAAWAWSGAVEAGGGAAEPAAAALLGTLLLLALLEHAMMMLPWAPQALFAVRDARRPE